MEPGFLFEFLDKAWLPTGLRCTMREILECGNSLPFRSYYRWTVSEIIERALDGGFREIVELGAGSAPLTRALLIHPDASKFRLVACDAFPDLESFRHLESASPIQVAPVHEPVDFTQPRNWGPDSLLVISAAFHHIPPALRAAAVKNLSASGRGVMIFEPLNGRLLSYLFVLFSLFPALLLPIAYVRRPGRLRRLFWCWLIPLAPIFFIWDGWVSCLRQWSPEQWRSEVSAIPGRRRKPYLKQFLFSQVIAW